MKVLVKNPLPGILREVNVVEGQQVQKGDTLVVIESMKMLNDIKSDCDGRVTEVFVSSGSPIKLEEILLEITKT